MEDRGLHSVELKYCERCGNLGLRRQGSGRIYCRRCDGKMAETHLAPSPNRPESAETLAKKACARVEWEQIFGERAGFEGGAR